MSESIARHVDGEIGDLAVIYCDLNDFKPINDRYGHEAGDEVLRATSRRIVGALRQGDVVARIGGDEFLAFCPGADAATADALRRRIQDAAAEPVTWQDRRFAITVAVGSTVWSEGRPVAPDDLLAAADAEMYAEKRARRQPATR